MREAKLRKRIAKHDELVDKLLKAPVRPGLQKRSYQRRRQNHLKKHGASKSVMKKMWRRRGKRLDYEEELDVAWWKSRKAADVAQANDVAKATVPTLHFYYAFY